MTIHTKPPRLSMTVEEYFVWSETQPKGRRELIDGEVVELPAERNIHWMTKKVVMQALEAAVEKAGLDCIVAPDGPIVVTGERDAFEPDCLVQCGGEIDLDAVTLDSPVILVEVTSPSTATRDAGVKLAAYFRIPSVEHYLIISPAERMIVHHRRDGDAVRTTFHEGGELALDPPGLIVAVVELFPKIAQNKNRDE